MRMSLGRQSSMPKAEQKYNIIKDKKLKTVRSVTRVSHLKRSSERETRVTERTVSSFTPKAIIRA